MVELGFRRAAVVLLLSRRINLLLLVAAVGGPVEWCIFCPRCFFSGGRGDGCCFDNGACVPLVYGQDSVSVFLLLLCERVGVCSIPMGGWLVWVAWRRRTSLPVVGLLAGDGGTGVPLLFCQGGLSSYEGDGSDLLPRELFLLRWRLCRWRQTPVPVTGVIISDGGSLAALPRPQP